MTLGPLYPSIVCRLLPAPPFEHTKQLGCGSVSVIEGLEEGGDNDLIEASLGPLQLSTSGDCVLYHRLDVRSECS